MNQTKDDYLIYDADDEVIKEWLKNNKIQSKKESFSKSFDLLSEENQDAFHN